jgi:peptidyl-prolyl cis-trans isomerase D
MLDIMRRKKRLKMILWVVIFALTISMFFFFIPGMNTGVGTAETSVASVDGKAISMQDLAEAYRRVLKNYSNGGRNRLDPEMLKSMGLPRQVLDGLIMEKVIEFAAEKMGVDVTVDEVRQAVESYPFFQDQGKFIGIERYKAVLASNSVTITNFEEDVRNEQLAKKVRQIITDAMSISDRELRDEFARTNQQTVVDYVLLKKEDFKKRITPTEAELRSFFDGHKDQYKVKEKRKAQYLLVPASAIIPTIKVTDQEIQTEWNQRSHEETVEAAHILFRIEDPSKEAEVKTKAESVLKQVKAGGDFAKLAKKYSDDTGSATQGGVLPPFQKGQMGTKEFEDASFAMKAGETSGLVRSPVGFHIIKVLRHETPTLQSSRDVIVTGIQTKKAQEIAKQKAEQAATLAKKQKDFGLIAKELGVSTEIRETSLFKKDDNPFEFGISQTMRDAIFELKQVNEMGDAVEVPLGYAVPKLAEVQMPRPGEFAESRSQVEKDYLEAKTAELMQADARKLSEEAGKQGSLEKSAKGMGLTTKTSQPFDISGTPDSEIGANSTFTQAASELAVGGVSAPVPLLDNVAVMQVKSRSPFDDAAFEKQKSSLRSKLLQTSQDPYFQDYIRKATEELQKAGKIRVNAKALEQIPTSY